MGNDKRHSSEIQELLERARKCDTKGRMYVYEAFKRELQEFNLDPAEYGQVCRKLAKYLRV